MTLNDISNFINNPAKLRWACRRGMLELDVLLSNFLDEIYLGLKDEDKMRFVRLLEQPDPQLFDWLIGKEVPEDPELQRITDMIRKHAQSRF